MYVAELPTFQLGGTVQANVGEYTKWLLAEQPRIWRISSYLVVLFSNLSWGNAWTLIDNSSLVHTWQQYK